MVAGPGVAGGQGGVETGLGDSGGIADGVCRGVVPFRDHGCRNEAAGSALRGFSSPREPEGKLRLGVGLGTGGSAEAAVFSCEQKMSDSEDSNFSEEEDSERSSDGEEAEVCGWDAGGGIAPGDRTRAERPMWELSADQKELWPLGASRLSGEIGK